MTTLTGSLAAATGPSPKGLHSGAWTAVFEYNTGIGKAAASTISNGDVILMGKIPHGATITDLYVIQVAGNGDTGSISVGIDDAVDDIVASQSTSSGAVIRWDHGLPYTVSVSDDATVRYQILKIGVDADYTATTQFKVVVTATNDP